MKKAIYNLTSDVIVMSSEIGLAPNLHTTPIGRQVGVCVKFYRYLVSLHVAEILSEK